MIPCVTHPWNDKITEMESRSVAVKVWGSGGVGREVDVTLKGKRKHLCSDGNIHCGYSGCDTVRVLQDVTRFTRWNWVKGVEDLYYFLQLCVNLYEEVKVLVAQLCPTLCDPVVCSPLSSSVHGILQARILEWVAISFYRASFWPREWTQITCTSGKFFTVWAIREAPRTLESIAIPFFRGSSWPSDWTWVSCTADECFTIWTTR